MPARGRTRWSPRCKRRTDTSRPAAHVLIDGAFNVNSTSVAAWKAMFRGIRDNPPTFRSHQIHGLVEAPEGSIAISRMNTATSDLEYIQIVYFILTSRSGARRVPWLGNRTDLGRARRGRGIP